MSDYSWKELMAVVFSREIQDTDKITSGAHTEIFFAATMLAQKTHAPNLKLQLGGSVTLCQVTDIEVSELPKTSTGYELIRYAESVHDHPDTFLFYGAPGGKDYYKDGSEYRDVNHFWFADKFFVGGIPSTSGAIPACDPAWPARTGKMSFRGPGTIAASTRLSSPSALATPTPSSHRPIGGVNLVEKVDYISHRPRRFAATMAILLRRRPEVDRDAEVHLRFRPEHARSAAGDAVPRCDRGRRQGQYWLRSKDRQQGRNREHLRQKELSGIRNEVDKTGVLRH